ncbi:MAG: hypothetical protein ACLP5H_20675 [Desulfomonilaceae bacterium]
MIRSVRLLFVAFISTALLVVSSLSQGADSAVPTQWKITSIRLCRNSGGTLNSNVDAIGNYPVYSFFIPRPVWTVNGTVVESQPVYEHGRLIAFELFNAAAYLKSGTKNTIKFSLPDQNASRIFLYDDTRPATGECYEFF